MAHEPSAADAVFDQARRIVDPAERRAFLDAACADRPEVRRHVEGLLEDGCGRRGCHGGTFRGERGLAG